MRSNADAQELAEIEGDETSTRLALRIPGQGRAGAYDRAERRTESGCRGSPAMAIGSP